MKHVFARWMMLLGIVSLCLFGGRTAWAAAGSSEEAVDAVTATEYTSGYWTYTVSDSGVTVTAYSGSASSVTIPGSLGGYTVTGIGSYAFEDSTMTSVTIPEGITTMGDCAFYNCTKLTSITINAKNLDDQSYWSSAGTGSVYDNYKNRSVFYNAGADSSSLKVTFGSSVKKIPAYLFATAADYEYGDGDYAHITSVVISNSVEEIGTGAFLNCYDLTSVSWGTGITTIGEESFYNTSITSVTIPSGTTSIGDAAFHGCTKLTSITINAKNLEDQSFFSSAGTGSVYDNYKNRSAFYDAGADSSSLKVTFGSSVKKIPAYLFATAADYEYGDGDYAHITSVVISSSVEEIGTGAFLNCYDLKTVKVKSKTVTFADDAFSGCQSSLKFKCYRGSTAANYASTNGFKISYLDLKAPTWKSVTNTSSGVKLTWSKVSGATGYYVYRKTSSGSYKKIKTIKKSTTVSYTDTAVESKNGTTYVYKIVAYSSSKKGTSSAKTIVRLTTPTLSSVKNTSAKKITVKWKKVSSVSGYQIQYSTSKTFSKNNQTKKVSGASSVKKSLSGLTKGKTYYVRIRTYKKVSGKTCYSGWSSKKTVKVTK